MTVYEEIIEVCKDKQGVILTTAEIVELVHGKFGRNKTSILPSDYCYNRLNAGINFDKRKHIFIMIGVGEYKYVGENYSYTGFIYCKPQEEIEEKIAGEWKNGKLILMEESEHLPVEIIKDNVKSVSVLNQSQIQTLYEEYMEILKLEVNEFGCKPTETRHLIGRLGEFKCALQTNGELAREVNQHGFDVISSTGKRISVKTTAQKTGFVSINKNTLSKVDELMVIQYDKGKFKILYHGDINKAVEVSRTWGKTYELDLSKAKKLNNN